MHTFYIRIRSTPTIIILRDIFVCVIILRVGCKVTLIHCVRYYTNKFIYIELLCIGD